VRFHHSEAANGGDESIATVCAGMTFVRSSRKGSWCSLARRAPGGSLLLI
jgi:hypothetical protein